MPVKKKRLSDIRVVDTYKVGHLLVINETITTKKIAFLMGNWGYFTPIKWSYGTLLITGRETPCMDLRLVAN